MALGYLGSDALFPLDRVDTLESGFDFNELRPLEVTEGVFLLGMADETPGMLLSLFSGNSGALSSL